MNNPIQYTDIKASVNKVSLFLNEYIIKDPIVTVKVLKVSLDNRNVIAQFISVFGRQRNVKVDNALNVTAGHCRVNCTI